MMQWNEILNQTRVRELYGKDKSKRQPEDQRSEFARDYDRAIFSTPVRRLQDKAQVFPLESHDSVRTRLTHSLEVSTLARGLSARIADWLAENSHIDNTHKKRLEIIDIAATCGLIHDLGNPPFGHAGEGAIRDWFTSNFGTSSNQKANPTKCQEFFHSKSTERVSLDFKHFDGNAQTIRLVSRLQVMRDHHGLNLTAGTVSAALKYVSNSAQIDKEKHHLKTTGYFCSEDVLIEKVRAATGGGLYRNPITLLVEACDDIAYATVDLEDGVKKGVISWNDIEDRISGSQLGPLNDILNELPSGSPSRRDQTLDETQVQIFRTILIGRAIACVSDSFIKNYDSIINAQYFGELLHDSDAHQAIKQCKDIAKKLIIPSEAILRLEVMGTRVIHDLLTLFWDALSSTDGIPSEGFANKIYQLMSPNYRTVFEENLMTGTLPEAYCKLQLVTDYICGMTDTFACSLHKKLFNG